MINKATKLYMKLQPVREEHGLYSDRHEADELRGGLGQRRNGKPAQFSKYHLCTLVSSRGSWWSSGQ